MSYIFLKRIVKRELPELKKRYGDNIIVNEETNTLFIESLNIEFIMSGHYPFQPPKIIVNEEDYIDYLVRISQNNQKKLNEKGVKCLCCESITCRNNWNPTKKLFHIVEEYLNIKKLINNFHLEKYVDLICYEKEIYCEAIINKIKKFVCL